MRCLSSDLPILFLLLVMHGCRRLFVDAFVVSSGSTLRPLGATKEPVNTAAQTPETISRESVFPILLEEARAQVESGSELSRATCDNLLEACSTTESLDSYLTVIQQQRDQQRAMAVYKACLDWCHETANAAFATRILQSMPQPNSTDVSTVVRTICRANKLERSIWNSATSLVESHNDLELSAYDAYLTCLSSDGLWKESVRLLRQMQEGKTMPILSTYTIVIETCLYCNQAEKAGQLLVECFRQGIVPTAELCEQVVKGLSRRLQWRKAMQIVDIMGDLKLSRTLGLYSSLLTALAKSGESVPAKNLLQRIKKEGIQPNTLCYNSVIAACANPRNWKDALLVFDQCLREPGVSPDIYTYTNAIRACAKGSKADRALSLLQVAEDTQLPVDAYCYTAAIEACAKVKLWKKALELLEKMERQGIAPSEVTYSVTITACGNGGNWEKAMELLDLMTEKKMRINIITYNAAIAALSKAAKTGRGQYGDKELWKTSMELLDRMKSDGIEPDGFSFSSAISCCGAYGKWKEALDLFKAMKDGGARTQPNKIAYTAAISSCAKAGQFEQAVSLFREMKDTGLAPDLVAYNTLFSAFRVAGEGDLAYQFWNEMINEEATTRRPSAAPRPDVITMQEAIGAMTRAQAFDNVDAVFADSVERGIIFDADCFDTSWEVDLTKMTLSVARAACRYILRRAAAVCQAGTDAEDLVFITGVGRNHDADHPSLREYVRELLKTDFTPAIESEIPQRASGTVAIKRESILAWASAQ